MATLFTGNSQVGAGDTPFLAVWPDPAASRPELREQMGKLVQEGAFNFMRVIAQSRIQSDELVTIVSAPGTTFQPPVPFDTDLIGDAPGAVQSQKLLRAFFEGEVDRLFRKRQSGSDRC